MFTLHLIHHKQKEKRNKTKTKQKKMNGWMNKQYKAFS